MSIHVQWQSFITQLNKLGINYPVEQISMEQLKQFVNLTAANTNSILSLFETQTAEIAKQKIHYQHYVNLLNLHWQELYVFFNERLQQHKINDVEKLLALYIECGEQTYQRLLMNPDFYHAYGNMVNDWISQESNIDDYLTKQKSHA